MKQIVYNNNGDSTLQSFDATESFTVAGVPLRTIEPDSFYERAQTLVCKPPAIQGDRLGTIPNSGVWLPPAAQPRGPDLLPFMLKFDK
jgi:hypothetical protein